MPLCPICERQKAEQQYKPFCSKRCADLDLSQWLNGGYAIPGLPTDQADETPGRKESSEA